MVDGRERERTKKEEKQAPCPRESISTSGRESCTRCEETRGEVGAKRRLTQQNSLKIPAPRSPRPAET